MRAATVTGVPNDPITQSRCEIKIIYMMLETDYLSRHHLIWPLQLAWMELKLEVSFYRYYL